MRGFLLVLGLLCGVLLAAPLYAASEDGIDFIFPVQCTLGTDCFTVNYVDQGAGDSHVDYECGRKTYDAHKGTDFAVPNRKDLQRGVNVLAARAGKVLRVRNGESDRFKSEDEFEAIKTAGKECGNGVLVEHESGWQSLYCHLKEDSIIVKPGQSVEEGEKLAQIGQSGFSEFPHLHFSVLKDGLYLDPFTGLVKESGCGFEQNSLWRTPIAYEPFTLFDQGFAVTPPDFKAVQRGLYDRPDFIALDAPSLVYWNAFYQAVEGDEVTMTITDPQGHLFHQRHFVLERNKKRPSYYYAGLKTRSRPLMVGDYIGRTQFVRKDQSGQVVAQNIYETMIHVK